MQQYEKSGRLQVKSLKTVCITNFKKHSNWDISTICDLEQCYEITCTEPSSMNVSTNLPACGLRRNNKRNQDLEVNSLQEGGPLVLFKAQVVSKGIDTSKKFHHWSILQTTPD